MPAHDRTYACCCFETKYNAASHVLFRSVFDRIGRPVHALMAIILLLLYIILPVSLLPIRSLVISIHCCIRQKGQFIHYSVWHITRYWLCASMHVVLCRIRYWRASICFSHKWLTHWDFPPLLRLTNCCQSRLSLPFDLSYWSERSQWSRVCGDFVQLSVVVSRLSKLVRSIAISSATRCDVTGLPACPL